MTFERRRIETDGSPQVEAAVAAILAGKRVVLPTETVYGSVHLPSGLTAQGQSQEHALHAASAPLALNLALPLEARAQKLTERYWPGPLTLITKAADGGTIGLRVPAHRFTQQVLARCGPLLLIPLQGDQGLLSDPDQIATRYADSIDLLFEDGETWLGQPSTVVDTTSPQFRIIREGILSASEVFATASKRILFLCTGNTCRSPLAAALCVHMAAEALGVLPADLPARGLMIQSAGVATIDGMPVSDGSRIVAAEVGLDLATHRSIALRREHLKGVDLVYCMSASHLQRLQGALKVGKTLHLLDPDGFELADPYGGPVDVYRTTCRELTAMLKRRLPEILADASL